MYTKILSDPDLVRLMQERFPEDPFCKWLEAQGGYVWHGKYKHTTAKFVWENDPEYARWVKELPQPSKGMIAIKRYRKRRRESDLQLGPKCSRCGHPIPPQFL